MSNTLDMLLDDTQRALNVHDYDSSYVDIIVDSATEYLEENGLENAEDLLTFYSSVAVLCENGSISIDRELKDGNKFGFKDLLELFSSLDAMLLASEDSVGNQLRVSQIRSVSFLDDNLEKYLIEDLVTVRKSLGLNVDSLLGMLPDAVSVTLTSVSSDFLEDLRKIEIIRVRVNDMLKSIMEVYDESLQMGFQLDPYVAMLISKNPATLQVKKFQSVQMMSTLSTYLGAAVRNSMSRVEISDSRQFDLEEIMRSQSPIYYPRKMAEFALGYRPTLNITDSSYSKIPKRVWTSSEGYAHRTAIEEQLTELMWQYLEKVITSNSLMDELLDKTRPVSIETVDLLSSYLVKFKNSVCSFAVLKNYTGTLDNWASLEVIIATPTGYQTTDVFAEISSSVLKNSGRGTKPIVNVVQGIEIRTYSHVVDAKIAEATPLFAYKALEALQASGMKLDVNNMLIGRGLEGGIIVSSEADGSPMNLRMRMIHGIFAQSRAGKGVQLSLSIATAMGAGKPLFGVDRKPDTMVEMYILAGGSDHRGTPKGYFVNGGAYNKDFVNALVREELDWDTNPKVASRWRSTVPEWWGITSYSGVLGDLVYFRHILLTLGIVLLRVQARGTDPALYETLNGDGGISILYDEITNWQNSFSKVYLRPGSPNSFFNDAIFYGGTKETELKKARRILDDANSSPSALTKSEMVLEEALKDDYRKGVYARDLFENLNKTISVLSTAANAGLRGVESKATDIYLVGQALEVDPLKGNITMPLTKARDISTSGYTGNTDALSHFLLTFDTDFLMGRNDVGDLRNYAWRGHSNSDSSKFITETSRRFGYFYNASYDDLREGNRETIGKSRSVKTYTEGGAVYYKPYLILNSADENSRAMQDLKVALGNNYETVKANHSDGNGKWHKGIGFSGFVEMMGGDPARSLVRAREIADMVVKQMGYKGDYLDFLMDLRPEWNFSAQDVVDAYFNPSAYAKRSSSAYYRNYLHLVGESEVEVDNISGTGWSDFSTPDDDFMLNDYSDSTSDWDSSYVEDYDSEVMELEYENDDVLEYVGSDTTKNLNDIEYTPFVQEDTGSRIQKDLTGLGSRPEVNDAFEQLALAYGVSVDSIKVKLGEPVAPVVERSVPLKRGDNFDARSFSVPNNMVQGIHNLVDFITMEVINDFGGRTQIETIEVKGGNLIVNGVKYVKNFPSIDLRGLPIDKRTRLENKMYADLFDFSLLPRFTNLTYLKIDSPEFLVLRVSRVLKLNDSDNILKIFDVVPSLQGLFIKNTEFSRKDANESLAKSESFLFSARRRAMVVDRADESGRNFRRARWDSTKRYWSTTRGFNRLFGITTNMTGVAVGSAIQGGAKVSRLARNVLKSASDVFSGITRDMRK